MATRGEEYSKRKGGGGEMQNYRKGNKDREMKEGIRDREGGTEGRMNRDWCQ